MIRAVIVEDEPLARRTLHDFSAHEPQLAIVAEAADGANAVTMIDRERPDLVFLDVQLPELSGLDVLARITHRPRVIFTTAFDRYAVSAFELQALDYLLKPFGRERFHAAVARMQSSRDDADLLPRARIALGREPLTRMFLRRRDVIVPVAVADVTRVDAAGDYVEVHANGVPYLAACTLVDLVERLDAERFVRIHRSHVVNVEQIDSMREHDERRLAVTMRDGTTIIASRAGSAVLRRRIV